MRLVLFIMLLLPACVTSNGIVLCEGFCNARGQGFSKVHLMGAGTCLCQNREGIENGGALCKMWNPQMVARCDRETESQLQELIDKEKLK